MKTTISQAIQDSIAVKQKLLGQVDEIERATQIIIESLLSGKKIVLFGNGGSASDAENIAAELVGRFEADRPGVPAIALTTNSSSFSAISNDYGYSTVFARQVEAFVREGDVAIGISTSGNSPNVVEGIRTAKQLGARTIGISGRDGGKLKDVAEVCIVVQSDKSSRIQEAHILIGHVICQQVEQVALRDPRLQPPHKARNGNGHANLQNVKG